MQVRPLSSPGVVSVYILAAKAKETVHAHVQASLTLLRIKKWVRDKLLTCSGNLGQFGTTLSVNVTLLHWPPDIINMQKIMEKVIII